MIAIFLTGIMTVIFPLKAQATHEIWVESAEIYVDGAAFEIWGYGQGSPFSVRLRDIAYVLNGTSFQFDVQYRDDDRWDIWIERGAPYVSIGTEMQPIPEERWALTGSYGVLSGHGYGFDGDGEFPDALTLGTMDTNGEIIYQTFHVLSDIDDSFFSLWQLAQFLGFAFEMGGSWGETQIFITTHAWRTAYAELLQHYMERPITNEDNPYVWHFTLHDINRNGIPELFTYVQYASGHVNVRAIYTFIHGEVLALDSAYVSGVSDGWLFSPADNSPYLIVFNAAGSGGRLERVFIEGERISTYASGFFFLNDTGHEIFYEGGDVDWVRHGFVWYNTSVDGEYVTAEVFADLFKVCTEMEWLRSFVINTPNIQAVVLGAHEYFLIGHWQITNFTAAYDSMSMSDIALSFGEDGIVSFYIDGVYDESFLYEVHGNQLTFRDFDENNEIITYIFEVNDNTLSLMALVMHLVSVDPPYENLHHVLGRWKVLNPMPELTIEFITFKGEDTAIFEFDDGYVMEGYFFFYEDVLVLMWEHGFMGYHMIFEGNTLSLILWTAEYTRKELHV